MQLLQGSNILIVSVHKLSEFTKQISMHNDVSVFGVRFFRSLSLVLVFVLVLNCLCLSLYLNLCLHSFFSLCVFSFN